MGDSIGRMIAFIVAVVTFALCVMFVALGIEQAEDNYIIDKTNKFVDECRVTGKVDYTAYTEYISTIYDLGKYNVTMTDETQMYYPKKYGKSHEDTYLFDNDDILAVMYQDTTGKKVNFPLTEGDRFTVEVRKKGKGIAERILNIFVKTNHKGTMLIRYGGEVGD